MSPTLRPKHRDQLEVGSGIAPEVSAERGTTTVTTVATLRALQFADYQRRVPGILFPVHTTDGQVLQIVYRPDTPRLVGGTPLKLSLIHI